MINRNWRLILNFLMFAFFVLIAAALQTTLLYYLFGNRSSVQIILVVMTYISLTRKPLEGVLFIVFCSMTLGILSTLYTSNALFACLCIFWGLRFLRAIVYTPSHIYFNWTALGTILAFHLITWILDLLTAPVAPHFTIVSWILEILITALFAKAILKACIWIDSVTGRLGMPEAAA